MERKKGFAPATCSLARSVSWAAARAFTWRRPMLQRAAVGQALLQDEGIKEVGELRLIRRGDLAEACSSAGRKRRAEAGPLGTLQERPFEVATPPHTV